MALLLFFWLLHFLIAKYIFEKEKSDQILSIFMAVHELPYGTMTQTLVLVQRL